MSKEINKGMHKIQTLMEEIEHDPKVAEQMEKNQRKYGTLTPEDLRKQFTI